MVDIAHKNLTGGDLHEPKGITAAPANSAYVADGAGSGVWTPTASFPGAFGAKLFHIRDERPSGTDGDTLTVSTWNARAINTEKADDLGLTASGNQLSLPAGTYWIEVAAVTQFSGLSNRGTTQFGMSKLRLRNVTDASTLIVGMGVRFQHSDDGGGNDAGTDFALVTHLSQRFVLPATKLVQVQNWVTNQLSFSATKGGRAITSGEVEVYLDLKLWRTA
jgi:hypothetical protein